MIRGPQFRFWLIALAAFVLLFYLFSPILLPFVAGMVLAYFFDPLADRLESWRVPRGIAAAMVIVFALAIVVLSVLLLIPVIERQASGFIEQLPGYIAQARTRLTPLINELLGGRFDFAVKDIGNLGESAVNWLGTAAVKVLGSGVALLNLLSLLVVTPIVAFYLLRDWDRIVARLDGWLPREHAVTIRQQINEVDKVLAGFLRGQGLICLILAAVYATVWTVFGLEFGLAIGLVTGILAFIPYAGTAIGFVLAMIVGIAQFSPDYMQLIWMAVIFFAIQQIEGTFLTPRLVGERVGLHPVWVMFALLAGGSLMGFTGVLVAVPIAAVVGVLIRFGVSQYLASSYYRGGAQADPATPAGGSDE